MNQRDYQHRIEQAEGVIEDMNDALKAIIDIIEGLPTAEDGATAEETDEAVEKIYRIADEAYSY